MKEQVAMYSLLWKNSIQNARQVRELLTSLQISPYEVRPFGRRRFLLNYKQNEQSEKALELLGRVQVNGQDTDIKRFLKKRTLEQRTKKPRALKSTCSNKSTQTIETPQYPMYGAQQVQKTIRLLYQTEFGLDFDQPPPSYLKYSYPAINPAILHSITLALLGNRRFYTQVLHVMNRMNLDPPFEINMYAPRTFHQDVEVQTDNIPLMKKPKGNCQSCNRKRRRRNSSPIESEWVTSEEDEKVQKAFSYNTRPALLGKRGRKHVLSDIHYRKRARYILESYQKQSATNTQSSTADSSNSAPTPRLRRVFKSSKIPVTPPKIEIYIKPKNTVDERAVVAMEGDQDRDGAGNDDGDGPSTSGYQDNDKQNASLSSEWQTLSDSSHNPLTVNTSSSSRFGKRLTEEEMSALSVFKNYEKGRPTNKLYIKNIHKNVEESELVELYKSFLKCRENAEGGEEVDNHVLVNLMQRGRMKGQAFVTFPETDLSAVEEALQATNGLLLKSKPLVVCYCRQQQRTTTPMEQQQQQDINDSRNQQGGGGELIAPPEANTNNAQKEANENN